MNLLYPSSRYLVRRQVRFSSTFKAHLHELNASCPSSRVFFGANVATTQLGALSRAAGMSKVLLVRDRDNGAASRTRLAEFLLMQAGVPCFQYTLRQDCATFEGVDHAVAMAQRVGADGIVAFGGGNTMDIARAVALVLTFGGKVADFEHAAKELKLHRGNFVPLILIPTIAGSGAELTKSTVLLDEGAETKVLFAPTVPIVPKAVFIDPTLMKTVPLKQTVQGALTSLGQCLESYLLGCESDAINKLTMEGVKAVVEALALPLQGGKLDLDCADLREKIALGSAVSGIVGSSSGTGATQALAVSMGGVSALPYAQVATAFLPLVFDRYAELTSENDGDVFFTNLQLKLEEAADLLTATSGLKSTTVAEWLRAVITRFELPTVSTLELEERMVTGLVDRAVQYQDESMDCFRSDNGGAFMEQSDYCAIFNTAIESIIE